MKAIHSNEVCDKWQGRAGFVRPATWAQAILATGLIIFCSVSLASGKDDSGVIAREKDIPGKFRVGQCLPYAQELYNRFIRAGGEAHLVVYQWQNLQNGVNGQWSSGEGRHAIVVYRDAKGRYYGMDNTTWKPVWLKGQTPGEWAQSFAGMDASTRIVSAQTELTLKGRYPDRAARQGRVQLASN
jgi:hypothetical protein